VLDKKMKLGIRRYKDDDDQFGHNKGDIMIVDLDYDYDPDKCICIGTLNICLNQHSIYKKDQLEKIDLLKLIDEANIENR
jgi:hypothetical protein